MRTPVGQFSFSVLLFQDISVIPILAMIPLLALGPITGPGEHHGVLTSLPGWAKPLAVVGAVSLIILAGRYLVVPALRLVTKTRLRELFIASSILLVVAIAFLMEQVGLSPALGTFLAGVVLANSEFRHELETDLDPFKGLLLGLFFITVGASINFTLLIDQPDLLLALTAGIVCIKAIVLFILARLNMLGMNDSVGFAIGLSQIGEFAFVLFALIGQVQILDRGWIDTLMAVTALSMTVTPLLMLLNEKLIRSKISLPVGPSREADLIEESNKVILAGFSHFGSTIGRFLRANGVNATILDSDATRIDVLRKIGFKVYYGDVTRMDLLETAGAASAEILVMAIDAPETTIDLVPRIRKHFPNLHLMVRARNRFDAYELIDLGVTDIYRESVDTSVRLGVDVLRKLGYRGYSATRAGQKFLRYDEEALKELATHRGDTKKYVSKVLEQIALQEELLKEDLRHNPVASDHAWDSEEMKNTNVSG